MAVSIMAAAPHDFPVWLSLRVYCLVESIITALSISKKKKVVLDKRFGSNIGI